MCSLHEPAVSIDSVDTRASPPPHTVSSSSFHPHHSIIHAVKLYLFSVVDISFSAPSIVAHPAVDGDGQSNQYHKYRYCIDNCRVISISSSFKQNILIQSTRDLHQGQYALNPDEISFSEDTSMITFLRRSEQ